MADTEKDDKKKKPGEANNTPPNPDLFDDEVRARDPDEAVVAEQAIRSFVARRMADWYRQMEAAVDQLEAYILSQGEAGRAIFATRGFFDHIGDRYIEELYAIAGGKGTPVMDALASEVYNTVAWAQHSEEDPLQFVNYMRRGVRDATWFLRDNVGAVLANQWPQLLHLATSGSVDFMPALYAMGLPSLSFKPELFGDRLVAHAEAYRKVRAPEKQQAIEQAPSEGKKEELKAEAEKLPFEDEAKKVQQALTT